MPNVFKKTDLYLNKIFPFSIPKDKLNSLPVSMFIQIFTTAIGRMSDVKKQCDLDMKQLKKETK